ncbi:hypothetical protein BXY66_2303 [Shimia isoporae]|uniref:Uncharacterized protein n=1 Tax=Shimia isoporae TaxID=647720 RepID=A0A4R1NPE5_9RHOB|nr:hypothetical protein [Shimia isoporae]TCL10234.1 hypothetical protein BXY66_2303 [Shimia isoporae]
MSTALHKYDRLEATAIWRASSNEQRRDVIVSIGDATLVISDLQDRAITHWSIPAVRRANPGERPAIFHPDGDADETLEIGDGEAEMIDAIEKLRSAVARRQPRPGRLRYGIFALSLAALTALGVFWLPGALSEHALKVAPAAVRQDIGEAILKHTTRVTGQACEDDLGQIALRKLERRLKVDHLMVVPSGVREAAVLPGGTVLLNRSTVEDFEEPDVVAGFVIAVQEATGDPLRRLLEDAGIGASFRLLTTGSLPDDLLRSHVENVVLAQPIRPGDQALIEAFKTHQVRISPYAFALDPSGEQTLELIEADPFAVTPEPVLSDGDWVALQGICGA